MKSKKSFFIKNSGRLIVIAGISFLAYFLIKYFNTEHELNNLSDSHDLISLKAGELELAASREIEKINQARIDRHNECNDSTQERLEALMLGVYSLEEWCSQTDTEANRIIDEIIYKHQEILKPLTQDLRSLESEIRVYSSLKKSYTTAIIASTAISAIGLVLILGRSLIMSIIQSGNFGVGVNSGKIDAHKLAGNINEAQKQSLTEVAREIQQLLEHLSQDYPTTTTPEKMSVITEAVDQIERNPTLKSKVISALKQGGAEALREAVNHPLINILLATIEGWQAD